MKYSKVLILLLSFLILVYCSGCSSEYPSNNESYIPLGPNEVNTNTSLPLTRQVCDWWGIDPASIIQEQSKDGYVYTGTTKSYWCDNMLIFQHQSTFK